ncbi:hypothetical protein TanjilG_24353 [Lupinus angustifolius]|uniref:Pentatricopeptide repeat-containing protein n=1 Tax=Lupinus angustifolius TaxID=3871 RepID=A0A1J7IFR0_LUPAN|nr:hypothetical protein TanjilG_24353 [Lupinus angustifolius]
MPMLSVNVLMVQGLFFDDLVVMDVVSWTSCYVNYGLPRQGVVVFREMGLNGVKPNSVIVSSILLACLELKILDSGRAIHGFAVRHGMVENVFVCCALISIHSRPVDDGLLIFNSMGRAHSVEPYASHYSSMVDVFSHAGHLDEA